MKTVAAFTVASRGAAARPVRSVAAAEHAFVAPLPRARLFTRWPAVLTRASSEDSASGTSTTTVEVEGEEPETFASCTTTPAGEVLCVERPCGFGNRFDCFSTDTDILEYRNTLAAELTNLERPSGISNRFDVFASEDEIAAYRIALEEANALVAEAQSGTRIKSVKTFARLVFTMGLLMQTDKVLKAAFATAGYTFPAPLAGMFGIFVGLLALDKVSPTMAQDVCDFFSPALGFIQRWLPLFYVPSLVTLPLAIQGIAGADLAKLSVLILCGMAASLLFTAWAAVTIRERVKTEMKAPPPSSPSAPYEDYLYYGTAGVAVVSFASVALGVVAPELGLKAFLLAATVGGLLIGSALPASVRVVAHPILVCALTAMAGAAATGVLGYGFEDALRMYLTKDPTAAGAGDLLMSFLGVVILTFGFRIFGQRGLMARHKYEIFGAVTASALFSMFSTAFAASLIGLPSELARAAVPRSVTVALALPIANVLDAPAAITAATVVLTGLLGANFAQTILDKTGYKDPIARGLAVAGSAHGLGTAALAAAEPDALPFCALAYALMGVASTTLCAIPAVADALISITG